MQKKEFEAWDCCAGSGGKSILLADLFPGCRLTVSDIRESILKNLSERVSRKQVLNPFSLFKADLTDSERHSPPVIQFYRGRPSLYGQWHLEPDTGSTLLFQSRCNFKLSPTPGKNSLKYCEPPEAWRCLGIYYLFCLCR